MVGPRVYHIKHARSYPAFTADDPAKVMDLAVQWLKRHDFRVKRKSKQYSRGSKKGIHVNFVPKFKLYIEQGPNGHYVVRFDYYAKIKLGTAVVVGVLTSGISTVVGVGTLAIALSDADNFVDKFWKHIDSLSRGNPVILTVERWASDGKGGFVKQPLPPGTAVPAGGPTPPPPRQQALPPPPPPVYAPPPPPPPVHTDNRPRDTNPPQIQPGQVYGHSFIPTPVQASAPPPTPQYYPKLEKSNPPPPNNYHPPPPHAPAYGNYPPPQSPHGHYPPPPSPHNAYGHPPPPPPHAPHAYQPPTPTGHAYPPPPPAHGYPPPPPAHNYQPPPPGGYPPPPSQQGQRASSSQLAQHRPPPAQNTQPSAPRRPPPTPQSNYGDGQASQDGYAAHHDSYSAYYDSHGDRQSYYGGDAATEHSYYAAYTDPNGVYHEASYFEKRASTGSDDIPDSASSFAEQHGLGRYAEHHTNLRSSYYSDTKSTATNPSV